MRRFSSAVRVRYAPSPTGFVHLGGLRTALFNYLYAKHHGGSFFVRFEDTDRARLVEGSDADIMKTLSWAGITWDETPEYQSARLPVYEQHAAMLLDKGAAYRCFCSRERLAGLRGSTHMYPGYCRHLPKAEEDAMMRDGQPFTLRLRVPQEGGTLVTDAVRGKVRFEHRQVDDQILMKSDGFPTYHMASVVDDHLMNVSDVIRGEEWLPSTVKHVLLYKAFDWEPPRFAHLPLLLSDRGGKLSKRHDDAAVQSFVDAGYQPEALVNFVAFLGWTPEGTDYDEVMDMQQLIEHFTLERVNKGGAAVSRKKLDWLNGQHVERMLQTEPGRKLVADRMMPFMKGLTEDTEYALKVLQTIASRLSPFSEIAAKCGYFFHDPDLSAPEVADFRAKVWTDEAPLMLDALADSLAAVEDWEADALMAPIEACGFPRKKTLPLLRFQLTGTKVGATIPETMATLGKETVLRRLRARFH